MELLPIQSKCTGLKVITPVHKSATLQNNLDESYLFINDNVLSQLYVLYKEYIQNFAPNLNAS